MKKILIDSNKPYLPYWIPRWIRRFEQYVRVKIFKHKRYLIDEWSIDPVVEFEIQHSVEMENELTKLLSRNITSETKKMS